MTTAQNARPENSAVAIPLRQTNAQRDRRGSHLSREIYVRLIELGDE
jgi:hypothetical protein